MGCPLLKFFFQHGNHHDTHPEQYEGMISLDERLLNRHICSEHAAAKVHLLKDSVLELVRDGKQNSHSFTKAVTLLSNNTCLPPSLSNSNGNYRQRGSLQFSQCIHRHLFTDIMHCPLSPQLQSFRAKSRLCIHC